MSVGMAFLYAPMSNGAGGYLDGPHCAHYQTHRLHQQHVCLVEDQQKIHLRAEVPFHVNQNVACDVHCAACTGSHEMLWKNLGVGTLVIEAEDERLELRYTVHG